VSSTSTDEVLVNLQLQPTSPEFGPCADTTGCEPGLNCAGGTWVRRDVALNQPCSLVTDRCPASAVCAPDGEGLRCLPNPASNDGICDTLAGLPACEADLVCEEADGLTRVCGEPGAALGEPCTDDDACESRFVCVSRACWPEPATVGRECLPDSPAPCEVGLDCVESGLEFVCVADTATPCTSDRDCTPPTVCFAETCQPPLSLGQPCGRETLPCGSGLVCGDSGECEVRLGGVDEFCTSSASCAPSLFCLVSFGGPDGLCAERRTEGQICLLGSDPAQCVVPLVCESDESSIPRCTALP
jgi:hypothetical protein